MKGLHQASTLVARPGSPHAPFGERLLEAAAQKWDLRSNDRRVLAIKHAYEHKCRSAYFVTKRGEEAPADKDQSLVVDLLDTGKCLMAWHSQGPNVSYSENKIDLRQALRAAFQAQF